METILKHTLNIIYRACNNGRTYSQQQEHKKDVRHAEEQACVLEQRPPPLPNARNNLSQSSLSTHPQQSSPLFTKLPREIRQHIYELVLGGDIIHLVDVSQRIAHHRYAHNEEDTESQDQPTGSVALQNPLGPRAPPTVTWLDERNRIPRPAQFSSGSLSLPLTCHAVYVEAIPVLYRSNTFSMASPLVLIYLKDYVLRPWRFANIRHLRLNPWVRFDNPAHFGGRVPGPHDVETWATFWGIVAGMELQTLGVWIEFWGKEEECCVEAGWVRPMLEIRGVGGIGLSIERRINLYERQRLHGLEAEIEKRWTRA
ncbi:MAG: hypothetical protein ASARMPRED_005102 [Alectoria sarmentosa]|nr:MAG: hypothetical protein ASARMPRED_005102 [Alectoria sarmentosa]